MSNQLTMTDELWLEALQYCLKNQSINGTQAEADALFKQWKASKTNPKSLYKSEDGVDMYKGMEEFIVDTDTWLTHKMKVTEIENVEWFETNKSFSTKEKAEEYINLHKPRFSLKDIHEAMYLKADQTLDDVYDILKNKPQ